MKTSVKFCLSYDSLEWDFYCVQSEEKRSVDMSLSVTVRVRARGTGV